MIILIYINTCYCPIFYNTLNSRIYIHYLNSCISRIKFFKYIIVFKIFYFNPSIPTSSSSNFDTNFLILHRLRFSSLVRDLWLASFARLFRELLIEAFELWNNYYIKNPLFKIYEPFFRSSWLLSLAYLFLIDLRFSSIECFLVSGFLTAEVQKFLAQ